MTAPVIAVSALRYTYPRSGSPAVCDMEFAVSEGEIFGFGPQRSRQDHDAADRHRVREDLQHFAMLHAPRPRDQDELLAAVGLSAPADVPVGTLSKGMRVRLNLARALLHRPQLLFLDEPTAGLDPVTARSIRDLIARESEHGATVFLTTHDMVDGRHAVRSRRVRRGWAHRGVRRTSRAQAVARRTLVAVGVPRQRRSTERDVPARRADGRLAALLSSPDVETVHTTEASLADVFVDVTGQRL